MGKLITLLLFFAAAPALAQNAPEDTPPTPGVDVPLEGEEPPPADVEETPPPPSSDDDSQPAQPLPQQFDSALTPYGNWLDVDGVRVWQPSPQSVGDDFVPYQSNGTWVYSTYGWSFQAAYPWAWAPFHYGRWWRHASYGWIWYPGTVWGASWVSWRYGGGYVGWAPLAPARFVTWSPWWSFCNTSQFMQPNVYRYVLPQARVSGVWSVTQPSLGRIAVRGRPWFAGPPSVQVGNAIGRTITPVAVAPPHIRYAPHTYAPNAPGRPPSPPAPQAPHAWPSSPQYVPHHTQAPSPPMHQSPPSNPPVHHGSPPMHQGPPPSHHSAPPPVVNAPHRGGGPSIPNAPHRHR